ncbi:MULTISPECIES: RrF2 family transcriptional regulator [Megasphaera]|uniref:Transcriptional regulator n=1 Tax=Megasphaera vaginalis (ex Srinivasan et al. 2021) TaxID=1111454 RepID=U7UII7_9FIRM|nr:MULTISPECIES: Rrf2 family transcriptional regulator [Megasphaera]ERT58699.1 transcriptional regulator [Megasphaera vaginalis (ex Srinivasan et al. 2021)]
MFMNKQTDYALRVIRSLRDGKTHNALTIAEEGRIPPSFTYKIVKKLANAGFIKLVRGPKGGCTLTADLEKVSLYDLILVMEGETCLAGCMRPASECEWRTSNGGCQVHVNLRALQKDFDQQLAAISLRSVLDPPAEK